MNTSTTSMTATPPQRLEHLGTTSENEFMNVSQAAALLGVHIQTLRRLARQKKIPAFKVGRDWRFRKEAAGLAPVLLLVKPVEQIPLERTIRALLGPRVVAKE